MSLAGDKNGDYSVSSGRAMALQKTITTKNQMRIFLMDGKIFSETIEHYH